MAAALRHVFSRLIIDSEQRLEALYVDVLNETLINTGLSVSLLTQVRVEEVKTSRRVEHKIMPTQNDEYGEYRSSSKA